MYGRDDNPDTPKITLTAYGPTNNEMFAGDQYPCKGEAVKSDGTKPTSVMSWESSNPDVASITSNGLITANKAGKTRITVTTTIDNKQYKASIDLTVKDVFTLTRDTYPFVNGFEGFSYEKGYRIPLKRYQEVFGDSFTQGVYEVETKEEWIGNCFGMCATELLYFNKKIDLLPLFKGKEGTTNSNGYGGESYVDNNGTKEYGRYLHKNSKLEKLIERYQVWTSSQQFHNLPWRKDYDNIIREIRSKKTPFTLWVSVEGSSVEEDFGHELIVDTSREVEDMGSGWYRVWLYDPDSPYWDTSKNKRDYYDDALSQSLEINPGTTQWKMNVCGVDVDYDPNNTAYSKSTIKFTTIDEVPTNFDTKASYDYSEKHGDDGRPFMAISYTSDNFTVTDTSGQKVFEKESGRTEYLNSDIATNYPSMGRAVDADLDAPASGKLVLPEGKYQITAPSGGSFSYRRDGDYAGIVAKDDITVTNPTSTALDYSSSSKEKVFVVAEDCDDSSKYTCIGTNLVPNETGTTVSLVDKVLKIDGADGQKADVNIESSDGNKTLTDVDTRNDIPVSIPKPSTPAVTPALAPAPQPDPAPVGTKATIGKISYQVTSAASVKLVKNTNKKAKKVTVPATVNVNGRVLPVTEIGNNAFKNNKKLTSVVIGPNVTKIGKNVFKGCKSLKKITVKTKKLSSSSIKNLAKSVKFRGAKLTVKVPKAKKKAYKKIFKKSAKKVKIK